MSNSVKLIVMLTNNDRTVENANKIFENCKDLEVECWGFKDIGIPVAEMQKLVKNMKRANKKTFLEVVSVGEKEGMKGAKLAVECGFDYLMGTVFYEKISDYLIGKHPKYYPFCGKIYGHPSILDGSVNEIINHAKYVLKNGAKGVDLLAYRYIKEDADKRLIRDFLDQIKEPVILAGSIDSWDRLEKVLNYKPWGFTIGSAFFNNKFGDMNLQNQIDIVLKKVKQFNFNLK